MSQPSTGADVNTWGPIINQNFQVLDNISGASTTVAFTSSNVTLTVDQAAYNQIICSGVLTASVQLIFPSTIGGQRTVINKTTGAFTITALNGAGDSGGGVLCPQSEITNVLLTGGTAYSSPSYITTAATNINGSTTGSTPAFGNIGYSITYTNTAATGPNSWGSVLGVTIQPGNWLIFGRVNFIYTSVSATSIIGAGLSTSNNYTSGLRGAIVVSYPSNITNPEIPIPTTYISIASPTIYYANSYAGFTGGSGSIFATMTIIRMP